MKAFFSIILSCLVVASCSAGADEYNQWDASGCEPCVVDTCCNNGAYFVGADWLYWKTEQTKMEFGAVVDIVDNGGEVDVTSNVLRPKFGTESGYRVFAGYEACDRDWIVTASFTHAPSKASVMETENPLVSGDFISIFNTNFPILSALIDTPLNSISANWDVATDYFDLDIARNYCVCSWITVSPHIGLRALWSNQKFDVRGANTDIQFGGQLKERIKGIGVEGGFWGEADCGCGFSLLGHIGGSVLYSDFTNHGKLRVTNGTNIKIQYKDTIQLALSMVDTFIGVRYGRCICNRMVDFHIGWEQHLILDTNQYSINGGGNMTMQGLTLGGSVAF